MLLGGVLTCACPAPARPEAPCAGRLAVTPVLFLPADAVLPAADEAAALQALDRHLAIARELYRGLLTTDSFCSLPAAAHHAEANADAYDDGNPADAFPDSAHRMVRELLEANHEDRNSSTRLFVAVMVRPRTAPCGGARACLGGGRTFNGFPGSGGGFVQLEASGLADDQPYPIQSTLVHELGHGLGLVHSSCYGEDMATGQSIMSYNPAHWSSGLQPSATPGGFLPEEVFLLDAHDLAFPGLKYEAGVHNPSGRALAGVDGTCELGAMDGSIGPMSRSGFQLFFDDALVSTAEAQFYTRGQARSTCDWNLAQQPAATAIRCLFDGVLIGSRPAP